VDRDLFKNKHNYFLEAKFDFIEVFEILNVLKIPLPVPLFAPGSKLEYVYRIFGVETLKNGTAMGNFTFEFRMTFPITETPFDDKRMKL